MEEAQEHTETLIQKVEHMSDRCHEPRSSPPRSRSLGRECDEALFSEEKKGGRHSVNEGFGKDFHRKGNSVKRFRPFSEPPDAEN